MSEPVPQPADATFSGHVPIELYAGPLDGQPMMIQGEPMAIHITQEETGRLFIYVPSDLRSRKGCRIFQLQPEIPF